MPELPEVETIRRELAPLVCGRRIRDAELLRSDIVGWPGPEEFRRLIQGCRIIALERKGKYLIFRAAGEKGRTDKMNEMDLRLIVHLRLSGQLTVRDARIPKQRFERARFELSGGKALIFIEPRALGRVYLVRHGETPPVLKGLQGLGPEPIQPGFNAAYLRQRLNRRRACIKALLLDQRIAAGVGNIYSDEALFRARIHPLRRACDLKRNEYPKLVRALRGVLRAGIRHMGTTMTDARYQRPGGMPGRFQRFLKVFDRRGMPCRVCGTTIAQCRIGNRTSRYCLRCQQ